MSVFVGSRSEFFLKYKALLMYNVLLMPLLAIMSALQAGILALTWFFTKWKEGQAEKKMASNIIDAFEKEDINGKFIKDIRNDWEQTERAFDHSVAALEKKLSDYVEDLRKIVDSYEK